MKYNHYLYLCQNFNTHFAAVYKVLMRSEPFTRIHKIRTRKEKEIGAKEGEKYKQKIFKKLTYETRIKHTRPQ